MAERADVTVNWGGTSRSTPRIITVGAPSSEISIQDLVDTLRSNTLQAGEAGNILNNMDDDFILDASGKEQLVGGTQVGITATLKNARLKFADRAGPDTEVMLVAGGNLVTELTDTGTQTGADSNTVYIDSAGGFDTFGLEPGMTVENLTDGSSATVVTVDSGTQITTDGLTGGGDNLFQAGDVVVVSGFTNPIEPSAFTTVALSSSSSATITNLPTIAERVEELWKLFGLDISDAITVTPSGITSQSGSISIAFTGDGVTTTTQTRQP